MNDLNKEEILRIIEELKAKKLSSKTKKLLERIEKFLKTSRNDIENYEESTIRFCDYFDLSFHGQDIITYFEENYKGNNKEENLKLFIIYSIFRQIADLLEFYELIEEEKDYLAIESCLKETIYDIEHLIETYESKKKKEEEEKIDMSFLEENRYNIFFAGLAYKDIKTLQKQEKRALINKLKGELSTEHVIHKAEGIDHVRDLYNIPIMRIQFADDYRIAFIRINGTTIILGVDIKTGKDSDYTRYDSVAKRIDEVYKALDDYLKGKLEPNAIHYKTVELLESFLRKEKENLNQL